MTDAAREAMFERLRVDLDHWIGELHRAWHEAREEGETHNEETFLLLRQRVWDARIEIPDRKGTR